MTEPANNGGWQDVPNSTGAAPNVPPVSGAGYPPSGQAYVPPPAPGSPQPGYGLPQVGGLSANAAAAISYLTFIPAVVFLLLDPYKRIPFVRFHAIQCIGLTVISYVVHRVVNIFFVSAVFGGAWTLAALIHLVINLVFFLAWLACIINAAQGKWFKLPGIGDFAMKQAQS